MSATQPKPRLTPDDVTEFLADVFPQMTDRFKVEEIRTNWARVRLFVTDQDLRPGGTVSGPSMFTLADCAFYIAVLAMIGKAELTVTTSATINFMRKPKPGDLTAEARLLKLGRSLAVGDVLIFSQGLADPVAQASLTYAIPPDWRG